MGDVSATRFCDKNDELLLMSKEAVAFGATFLFSRHRGWLTFPSKRFGETNHVCSSALVENEARYPYTKLKLLVRCEITQDVVTRGM